MLALAKVFLLPDAHAMLKQRSMAMRVKSAIRARGWLLFDAFNSKFDADKNGLLSPGEIFGMLRYLNVDFGGLTPRDVLDWIDAVDQDADGNISYTEFVEALRDPEGGEDDDDDDEDAIVASQRASAGAADDDDDLPPGAPSLVHQMSSNVVQARRRITSISHAWPVVRRDDTLGGGRCQNKNCVLVAPQPYEEEALAAERKRRVTAQLVEEREQATQDAAEEERVLREIQAWEDEIDEKKGRSKNPVVDGGARGGEATWKFDTGRHPRGATVKGDISHLEKGGDGGKGKGGVVDGSDPTSKDFFARYSNSDQRSRVVRAIKASGGFIFDGDGSGSRLLEEVDDLLKVGGVCGGAVVSVLRLRRRCHV